MTGSVGPDPETEAWAEWAALRQSLDSGQVEPLLAALAVERAKVAQLEATCRTDLIALLDELFPLDKDDEPNEADLSAGVEWWARTCIWWGKVCREAWSMRDSLAAELDVERARREAVEAQVAKVQALIDYTPNARPLPSGYVMGWTDATRLVAAAVPLEAPKEPKSDDEYEAPRSDEPNPSAATIAGIVNIVSAPAGPEFRTEFSDDDEPEAAPSGPQEGDKG